MLNLPETIDGLILHQWETYEPWFETLLNTSVTVENYHQWITTWSDVLRLASEGQSYLYTQHTLATGDEAIKAMWVSTVENVHPNLEKSGQALAQKLLDLDMDDPSMQVPLDKIRADVALFSEKNLSLATALQKSKVEYNEITAGMAAEWDGEPKNISQLGQLIGDKDRATRERAWHTAMGLYQNNRAALNDLYLRQIKLRDQVAHNAGHADYRSYAFQSKHRFGYTPEDCLQFHEAIEEVIVPAANRILERKRAKIGTDKLKPWDYVAEMSILPDVGSGMPLTPFKNQADLVATSQRIFDNLDPVLGNYFRAMDQHNMFDLDTRLGKATGGYCQTFPFRKLPFIFMNSTGTADNVQTLFHEAGHAFHSFEAMNTQPLIFQQRANMEFNEVASMAMEFLAAPYLTHEKGGFYTEKEAARHRIEHLETSLLFFPFMSVVDSFQHWVYTHIDQIESAAILDQTWDQLWQRFLPMTDWSGVETIRESGWHRKRHIFRYPFYYVEYALAQVGAMQVWRNSLDDHEAALAQYRHALSLGGTKHLPELFTSAGVEFRFDVPMLRDLVGLVEDTIEALENKI